MRGVPVPTWGVPRVLWRQVVLMTFTLIESANTREALAQRDREAAILVCAFPNRMREPMPEDLLALLEVLEG